MSDSYALGPDFLAHKDAATYLGLMPQVLYNLRSKQQGPTFIKESGQLFYRRRDLDAWRKEVPPKRRGSKTRRALLIEACRLDAQAAALRDRANKLRQEADRLRQAESVSKPQPRKARKV